MDTKINSEATVQDPNLTTAPQAGAEQKENHEVMESKEQDAGIRTLRDQLAGNEAAKVPTTETPDAASAAATESDTHEPTEEKVDGTTDSPTEEELAEQAARKHETEVYHAEVARVIADPRYHAMHLPGGKGVILNLTAAVKDGVELGTPSYNRAHGKDQERTAKSIAEIGLQHPLIVATAAMAEAAGMPVVRFATDPKKEAPLGEHMVVIDGNGRMGPLMKKALKEWPDIYAIFPSLDPKGEMDLNKRYVHININSTLWGGPDYLVLKVMEPDPHPAWLYMKELQKKGYGHTASNVLTTLKKGNITKTQLTKADLNEEDLFKRFEYAKTVHAQLVATFGEESDVLRTKQIPEEMVACLEKLIDKDGLEIAVPKMVEFLKSLKTGDVSDITNAKGKDGLSKHAVRVTIFHNKFEAYIATHK